MQQLEDNVAAVQHTEFTADELAAVDAVATDDPDIDLWREPSEIGVDAGALHEASGPRGVAQ